MEFGFPADHKVKRKESEKVNKYLDLARELKKAMEHKSKGDTNCSWVTRNSSQSLRKETGVIGDQRKDQNRIDPIFVEIS